MSTATAPILATLAPATEQMRFLLRAFPSRNARGAIVGEALVYGTALPDIEGYAGSPWDCFDLTNGAGFMAPRLDAPSITLRVPRRVFGDWRGQMSPQAAGIVVTLAALDLLATDLRLNQCGYHWHLLLEFAMQHPEANVIRAAIG